MSQDIRPFPVASIRESVLSRLDGMKEDAVVVAVDARLITAATTGAPPQAKDLNARFALMVKRGDWSFAGWMSHTSGREVKDTAAGFEIRRLL